ncbi:TRAP transporter substrate-binding protein DctP [Uliginosibacterium sp. 31-16]|uniref:TRAP transporter substrate-binding protein DctP n=1 Tax=Uliginosibacterium sp. 31-16 TaxID=3068315 RepID=UPI00273FF6D0|nr:TRAP transporter substrate-binding protein DctP [Uliginosibacterium sp. 31-16]MDP5239648.1 TRAP transporter substrate-binding protein DctP [Uliginosibacterium sp. 31-16]
MVGAFASLAGMSTAHARDLVLAEVQPQGHILVQTEEFMNTRLASRSKGSLQLQIKQGGQLCNEAACWEKIKAGSLDVARLNLAVLSNDLPAVKLVSLPYLFRSRDHMWHVLAGDFGKRINSEAEKKGAVILAYYDSGTRSFYTTKQPIRSLADFSGLRIRVQDSPVYQDLIKMLGGTPVVVPYEKIDEAFRNGQIDGAENNIPSYVSSGHSKTARYFSRDEHSTVPEVLVISAKTWASLSPADKQALQASAVESAEYMQKQWANSEVQALAQARKDGVTITEKSQIAMTGIEGFAVKLYTKYVTNADDLNTILAIQRVK